MSSLSAQSELGELLNKMTLGVAKTLEKKVGVTGVRFLDKNPVERSAIHSWAQKNMCYLPNDLKDFYRTTDGILIEWSVLFDGASFPLGKMEVNPIGNLTPLCDSGLLCDSSEKPSLLDLDDISDDEDVQGNKMPRFDDTCKLFELDSCGGFAKVCLVYKDIKTTGVTNCTPEIWLLDRSLKWSFLATSFQSYFRMLIVHLGLPLWQYRFTQAGLSPETQQWFNLYAPSRLTDEPADNSVEDISPATEELVNQLDVSRVFKGKQESSKTAQKQGKKKPTNTNRTNTLSRFGQSGFRSLTK